MKRYVFYIAVALLTFTFGISCAVMLGGAAGFSFGRVNGFILAPLTLLPSAVCFSQAFRTKRGLRRSTTYNLLMLSLSGLLFVIATFTLLIVLVINSTFGLCTR
jgi:hypothetical protein